jgi:hypothetical protein
MRARSGEKVNRVLSFYPSLRRTLTVIFCLASVIYHSKGIEMANPEVNLACLPPETDYFASREGAWSAAVSKIDKVLDPKTDTNTLGVWLLTK